MDMLTRDAASFFFAPVRNKGAAFFRGGRVAQANGGPTTFSALVEGDSDDYKVVCEIPDTDKTTLLCSCECPYAGADLCKHIWASLLYAESKGFLTGFPLKPIKKIRLLVEDRDEDEDEEEEQDEPLAGVHAIFQGLGGSRQAKMLKALRELGVKVLPGISPAKPKPPPPPTWKQELAKIGASAGGLADAYDNNDNREGWGVRKEVVYVIDAAQQRGGMLGLQLQNRELKSNGEWGKPRNGAPRRTDIAYLPEADRAILYNLYGGDSTGYSRYYSESAISLTADHARQLLPALSATGKFLFRPYQAKDLAPLVYDANPWKFLLDAEKSEDGKSWLLTGLLTRDNERRPVADFPLLLSAGFTVRDGTLSEVDFQGAFAWAKHFVTHPPLKVPAKEFDQFVELAYGAKQPPPLAAPPESGFEVRTEPMRPLMVVRKDEQMYRKDELRADVFFRYGDAKVEATDIRPALFDKAARTVVRRDQAAEHAAASRIISLGFKKPFYSENYHSIPSKRLPDAVRTLIAEGWHVEAEGKLYRTAGKFELGVSSGIDWFELKGSVDFDGKAIPLPKILEAVRNKQTMVDLGDGEIGLLPEEWLKKYALLAGVGDKQKDHVRFAQNQAGLLDALLAVQPDVDMDERFRHAREKFRSFKGVAAAKPSRSFTGELRPYQAEGLGWLKFLRDFQFGGCLADDMGLGKTVQVLAMLADRAESRPKDAPRCSLVVVPKSLVFNWKAESDRFAPKLTVLDHTGSERNKDPKFIASHDIVLTTYGILRNDVPFLKDIPFDYGILDESTAIKNSGSESAKACRLINAKHRLAMSGTPIENHLGELWSLFDYLNPGMLGRATAFQLIGGSGKGADEESRNILAQALRPYILRRTKDQVARDLPEKTEQTVFCELEPKQRKAYDDLKEYYRQSLLGRIEKEGMAKAKIQILEALLRLRQAACHPGLIDKAKDGEASAKLDALLPQLQEVHEEGHKALVFSQFTSFLDIVKKRLKAEGVPFLYLDGKTPAKQRQALVEKFQNDPDCGLFLISLKAGGVGLNLTAAEYVFLLDPWWNPAIEAQAVDRAHRIGQTKPVFAYRYIAKDTVEEKVLALQQSKKALADSIINADNSLIRGLKREDLELLLS